MKNKILALLLFSILNTSHSAYGMKKNTTPAEEAPSRVENFFSAELSREEFDRRLQKEKAKELSDEQRAKYETDLGIEQNSKISDEELNLRWQLQKQDTSNVQKFVDTLSRKKKKEEESELARYQRRIMRFDNLTKKEDGGPIQISRQDFSKQLEGMNLKERQVIANVFGVREQNLKEYLEKKIPENDIDFSFKMQRAIEDYEKLVRDEAYGKIFGRQKRVESILKGLLAIGAFAAFTGIMLSMVIVPAAQQMAEQKEKIRKLKKLDLGALQKNKEMIAQLKAGNMQALGGGAGGMHPFAQKVDMQKLFGRNLQQGEMESLSALSFRKDAIAKEEGELTQNPGNMSPEDIKTKLAELKMSKGLVDQQIALQEFDTRYSPHINNDQKPEEAIEQRKELIANLEEKIPNLEELMQKKKMEMATGQQPGEMSPEQLAAFKENPQLQALMQKKKMEMATGQQPGEMSPEQLAAFKENPQLQALMQKKKMAMATGQQPEEMSPEQLAILKENPQLQALMQKKKMEMAAGQQPEEGDQEQLEVLDGTINNLGAEIDYLKKRLVAEQEIVAVNIQPDESITDWQERIDEKEEAVLSAMREKIMEEGTIMRDEREPYESSKLRTTQLLLKLKALKQQREEDTTPEQEDAIEEQMTEQEVAQEDVSQEQPTEEQNNQTITDADVDEETTQITL